MVSGNPFAPDSEIWKAATSSTTTPTAAGSQDPFATVQLHDHFTAQPTLKGQEHFATHPSTFGGTDAAPKAEEYSFAELNPTALGRSPANKETTGSSTLGNQSKTPGFPHSPASSSVTAQAPGLKGFPGFSSQASTPRGGVPLVTTQDSHIQQQQLTAPQGFPGFNSQSSTPRYGSSGLPSSASHPTSIDNLPASMPPNNYQGLGSAPYPAAAGLPTAQSFSTNNGAHSAHPLQNQFGSTNTRNGFPVGFGAPQQGQQAFSGQGESGWQQEQLTSFPNSFRQTNQQPQQQPHYLPQTAQPASSQPQPQIWQHQTPLQDNQFGRQFAGAPSFLIGSGNAYPATGYPGERDLNQSGFPPDSSGQSFSGNAVQHPFYPPGDGRRVSQPNDENPELWDFASLSTLKPQLQLKSKAPVQEPKSKTALKPMRPTSDGSWVQPWNVDSSSRTSLDLPAAGLSQPVSETNQANTTPPLLTQSSQDIVTRPGAQQQQTGNSSAAQQCSEPTANASSTSTAASQQTQFSTTIQPSSFAAQPQQNSSRVPWALPPPKHDLPRPNTAGSSPLLAATQQMQQPATVPAQQTSGTNGWSSGWQAFSVSPTSMDADVATRLQQDLNLGGPSTASQDSTAGDAFLAKQLQDQWDRENGVNATSAAAPGPAPTVGLRMADKLGLRRPSGVAGIAPQMPPKQPGQARQSPPTGTLPGDPFPTTSTAPTGGPSAAGGSTWESFSRGTQPSPQPVSMASQGNAGQGYGEAASRARAFLTKAGYSSGTGEQDEELARKLQEEYDDEHARGLGLQHQAPESTASHVGWAQQPPHQASQALPQSSSTGESDEALAHRLQQEEIARQQQATAWPQQGYPPAQSQVQPHGYPQQGFPPAQTWWSAPLSQAPQSSSYPQGGAQQSWQTFGPTSHQQPRVSDDEALARKMQEEFDRERQQGAPSTAPQPGTLPSRPSAPSWRSRFDKLLAPTPDSLCRGCNQPIVALFGGQWRTALGGKWHPGCLRCGSCNQPISDNTLTEKDGKPYHMACFKESFSPRCCVCHEYCPEQNNQIRWTTDTFWRYKACPKHTSDGTVRCYACNRYQSHGEEWIQVSMEGGRHLCLDCVSSIVVDTRDAQPLYAEVQQFYEHMQMRLPSKPPLLLVESSALESAEVREGRCNAVNRDENAPVFHTRGLTLSMEYQNMRTVVRNRGNSFFDLRPEVVHIPGSSHCEVTAILVLAGLPRLMTGSILAHECMHAWLRLTGSPRLRLDVEEGLCQLMALLWLESQPPPTMGTWEERLTSYCAHQIRTESSPVYGDGFRAALENFQKFGLPEVVRHVKQTGHFAI